MRKLVRAVGVILIAAVVVLGGRWYMYVGHAESPYDEVGIALNGYMPEPLRQWGCDTMQARFVGQLPPYGCSAADGRSWI